MFGIKLPKNKSSNFKQWKHKQIKITTDLINPKIGNYAAKPGHSRLNQHGTATLLELKCNYIYKQLSKRHLQVWSTWAIVSSCGNLSNLSNLFCCSHGIELALDACEERRSLASSWENKQKLVKVAIYFVSMYEKTYK